MHVKTMKKPLNERFQQLAGIKPLYTLEEQNPTNRDTSKNTTSGVFKVDAEVEDETTEVTNPEPELKA